LIELLRLFSDNILPILLAAGAGFLIRRTLHIDPRPISQATFYVFSPALVFTLLVTTGILVEDILRMMGFAAVLIGLMGLLSWLVARALRLDGGLGAAFMLSTTFMNAGNYGMSVNKFAFGDLGLAWASLFFVTSAMMTNAVGVYIATVGRRSPLHALVGLARVPAVYAIPLGLLVRTQGIELPLALWRPIDLLASATVPSMLLILGMQMGVSGLPPQRGLLAGASAMRLLLSPALAWALAPVFGLEGIGLQVGVLEAAMPSAVLSTIIAIEFGVEPGFVTGAVLATTLLSPFVLTPLIAWLGG
jgi:hypothetical protein